MTMDRNHLSDWFGNFGRTEKTLKKKKSMKLLLGHAFLAKKMKKKFWLQVKK